MSHHKPYPAYKDSGVEWLGQVPEHWEVLPLRAVASLNDDEREQSTEVNKSIRYVDISTVSLEDGIGEPAVIEVQDAPSRAQRKAKTGDVILSTVRTYLRAIGQVQPEHQDCVFSTGFAVIRAGEKLTPHFLYTGLLSEPFLAEIEANSKGVSYPAINASEVMLFKLPVPPKSEQACIAEVLQRETTRMDALITKKTRFIELLREKRQALITQAVTKGLDPNAKMKDSGVEWLGEVPEHWEVKKVKYVAQLESGHTPSKQVPEFWVDCNIPWVSLSDSTQLRNVDVIIETAQYLNEKGMASSSAHLLPKGTVVFTRDATVGLTAILGREMAVSQHLIGWVPGSEIKSEFLLRVFNAMAVWLDSLTAGATIKTIGMDDVRKLALALPPLAEQAEIVDFVNRQRGKLDNIISAAERSIELLKERRSALITAAVTGQIDLREAA